jgi:hypothetical protein
MYAAGRGVRGAARVTLQPFDRVYGGWWDAVIDSGGHAAVERSLERYVRWVGRAHEPPRARGVERP